MLKASYTLRFYGRTWRIKATHLEILRFLKFLAPIE